VPVRRFPVRLEFDGQPLPAPLQLQIWGSDMPPQGPHPPVALPGYLQELELQGDLWVGGGRVPPEAEPGPDPVQPVPNLRLLHPDFPQGGLDVRQDRFLPQLGAEGGDIAGEGRPAQYGPSGNLRFPWLRG